MLTPALEEVLAFSGGETHAALTLELSADTETPISLFYKLSGDRPGAFLLESVEGGETLGRYSFIGFDVERTILPGSGDDPLASVEAALAPYRVVPREGLPRFQGGAVGYLGFDAVRHHERVPLSPGDGPSIPEALFLVVEDLAIFDHLKQRIVLLTHVALAPDREDRREAYRAAERRIADLVERLKGAPPPARPLVPEHDLTLPPYSANVSKVQYCEAVRAAKAAISAGEVFQVVLSQRLTVPIALRPFALYRSLRSLNPSPYMFYLSLDGWAVVGASPEVLVRMDGGEILVRPIAGTRPRGKTRDEDLALERELTRDEKELAEHRMLVDLGRNDVGRVARVGSVEVERALHVERYSHVMHIVSDVHGTVRQGSSAYDVLRACFPAGTVSGAPKIRAMELIAQLEPERRGLYAGAVGYFDFTGNMDTCIAIRTLIVKPGAVYLQAGAGIVFDSVPEAEHAECMNKAKSGLVAIAQTLAAEGASR